MKTIAYLDKKMNLDNKGQSSAELILIIGGLIIIILFIGNYVTNITSTTQNKLKTVITKERNFLINKI
ncbi:hypothetical protein [uncultured Methanobrevibacter sp.]|uniref:hypothetical protein n=1 Tax=uncultured Methanobrevibacter sp. TaxID=253161 RepID=UPI002606B594|nr:hypothetical protein [uncultured Methanobrevibacter sp.]